MPDNLTFCPLRLRGLGVVVDERADAINGTQRRYGSVFQPGNKIPVVHGLSAKAGSIDAGSRAIRLDLGQQLGGCRMQFFNHLALIV
jgi:hypothetical protein